MNTPRIAAFFAATTVTALLLASQLGLAHHYATDAGPLLARGSVIQQAQAAAVRTPG